MWEKERKKTFLHFLASGIFFASFGKNNVSCLQLKKVGTFSRKVFGRTVEFKFPTKTSVSFV
jgi:hypothetical protein